MYLPIKYNYFYWNFFADKKNKKQKWISIETEVISIASGTCWADEAEKEHNGKHGTALSSLYSLSCVNS